MYIAFKLLLCFGFEWNANKLWIYSTWIYLHDYDTTEKSSGGSMRFNENLYNVLKSNNTFNYDVIPTREFF